MSEVSESGEVPRGAGESKERDAPPADDGWGDDPGARPRIPLDIGIGSDATGESKSEAASCHDFVPEDDGWGHDAGTRRGRQEAAIEAARAHVREALASSHDPDATSECLSDTSVATDGPSDRRRDLTGSETASIRDYTKTGYVGLNDKLRHGRELSPHEAKQVEHIDAALQKLPSEELTLFRGVPLSDAEAGRYVPGYLVTERQYTSASHEPDRSFHGNTEFVILAKNGKSLEHVSAKPDEHEVLIPRDTAFKVTAVDVDGDFGRRTIYLEEYVDEQ